MLKPVILSTLFQYDSWAFHQASNIWPHLACHFKPCLILNGRADPLRSHSLNLSLVRHQVQDDYLKFVWTLRENKIELGKKKKKTSPSKFLQWFLAFQLLPRNDMKAAFVPKPFGTRLQILHVSSAIPVRIEQEENSQSYFEIRSRIQEFNLRL